MHSVISGIENWVEHHWIFYRIACAVIGCAIGFTLGFFICRIF